MTTIIGIAVGNPYRRGIGLCVIDASSGEPVDTLTLTPVKTLGERALPDAAARTVEAAAAMVEPGPVVWSVEDVEAAARRLTRPERAASARSSVRAVLLARHRIHDAVLDRAPAGVPVINTPHVGEVPSASCPAVLSGPKPAGWAGERGQRREVQRTAWMAANTVLRPVDPDGYRDALQALTRAALTDGTDPGDACTAALAAVTRPTGAPAVTADALTRWATRNLEMGGAR